MIKTSSLILIINAIHKCEDACLTIQFSDILYIWQDPTPTVGQPAVANHGNRYCFRIGISFNANHSKAFRIEKWLDNLSF